MIVQVVIAFYKLAWKNFGTSMGFEPMVSCISAAVLYQLCYEDAHIGSKPISWVQFWVNYYLNISNYHCDNQ